MDCLPDSNEYVQTQDFSSEGGAPIPAFRFVVNIAITANQKDAVSIPKKKRICMSYVDKCVRANKHFFLADNVDGLNIGNDVFIDGKIITAPRKGTSNEFNIVCDTLTFPIPID
jgi:hypothetical protein